MFRSRFFWRTFLSYVLIIASTTFALSYLLTVRTTSFVEKSTQKHLEDQLAFLLPSLREGIEEDSQLEELLYEISEQTGTRITVIETSGLVIFDTQAKAVALDKLDNHSNRPEFIEAITTGEGSAMRFSGTIQLPMIYHAALVEKNQRSLVVRLSVPISSLNQRLQEIRDALAISTLLGMFVSLMLAIFLARRFTRPIAAITRVAKSISNGDYAARVRELPQNELGTLGKAINRLAKATQSHIYQREKLEKIRQEFSSNVSHELKTPLTSINGYVETLLAGAIHDKENNVRFLRIIQSNIERIISLVNDLLRLSSIEANEDMVSLEPVDWTPIIQDVVNRHAINFQKKQIQFKLETQNPIPKVMGMERALSHILDNLLQNAAHYTPSGGKIWIRSEVDSRYVTLHVSDTGIGIAKSDQSRIFERFYRVDAARSRAEGGTGLGLAIVKHLVIQIHGQIEVESSVGEGSTFKVRLKRADMIE